MQPAIAEEEGPGTRAAGGYTVVGLAEDGAGLNRAVLGLRRLGVGADDLTVVLKRRDPLEPEPFPEGTRYIVVPDDHRGLELSAGFAAVFVVSGLLFAFTAPQIGAILFVFFIALAAILAAGAFVRVGVDPILIDLGVPPEDADLWNSAFERGRVLLFAGTRERGALRGIRQTLLREGADCYVVERLLRPRPVSGAVLHRAGEERRG
ncbi:hypothetical protein Rxyl_2714 [Rubrobacter xylanophilus DSM 9941]|uniref:Uncharacterized protein n=1 Tax=Rubrobacter xylanophilus (strain DSM 9941 / JCM 11954 / NBRC 16129 / PRD-1) TaxID=266117 RepID=Q1ASJ9_RUBXD|nr:hypothetical protein [Rubrobacter xylanophilus]ABG05629.1 hypothetical protein Rxyl_2714 [Rubrobacter xylanophilus DSM 9941]